MNQREVRNVGNEGTLLYNLNNICTVAKLRSIGVDMWLEQGDKKCVTVLEEEPLGNSNMKDTRRQSIILNWYLRKTDQQATNWTEMAMKLVKMAKFRVINTESFGSDARK
jgi:hypothetical protein